MVTAIGEGMRRRIVAKAVPAEKVRLIPNFVDVDYMLPLPKDNAFGRQHGLVGSFVVTYAGNMGPVQGLHTILEAAALLAGEPGLLFVLVGEGSDQAHLRAAARDRDLANVMVLPHQPYELVPQIYAASDFCVVPLASRAGADAIPSKVYRIMACERAVLACTDADSDLGELVRAAGCGLVVPHGSADKLAEAVLEAKRSPLAAAAMGRAGRAHVLAHYSRAAVSALYEGLIREAAGRASR
jgi:colanic acid biosynthesis glycosyl transferase WcaI